jgi:hypothetical protein
MGGLQDFQGDGLQGGRSDGLQALNQGGILGNIIIMVYIDESSDPDEGPTLFSYFTDPASTGEGRWDSDLAEADAALASAALHTTSGVLDLPVDIPQPDEIKPSARSFPPWIAQVTEFDDRALTFEEQRDFLLDLVALLPEGPWDHLFFVVDNSGSMTTATVQPGLGELSDYVTANYPLTTQHLIEFPSEDWLHQIAVAINEASE